MLIKSLIINILIGLISVSAYASKKELKTAGDVLQIAIPATAFLTTVALDDTEGSIEFLTVCLSLKFSSAIFQSYPQRFLYVC